MHFETLTFMALVIGIVLAVGLTGMGWMLRSQPGMKHWVLTITLMTGASVVFFVLRLLGVTDSIRNLILFGALYAGPAIARQGLCHFCDRRGRTWPAWTGLVLFLAWIYWYTAVEPSVAARGGGYSFIVFVWSVTSIWTVVRYGSAELRTSTVFVFGAYLVHGLYHGARTLSFVEGAFPPGLLPGWKPSATVLEAIVAIIAMNLGLIFIASHRMARDLERTARIDPLTGLLNRRALGTVAADAIRRCRRRGQRCSLLLLDLDHFKTINNHHGHAAGDAALQHFSRLVAGALREGEILGRYGGEEFVVLLPGTFEGEAREKAEQLRRLVAGHPASYEGHELRMTVSIGVTSAAEGGLELEALLGRADEALYQAKDEGRDRILVAGGARPGDRWVAG